MTKQWVISAFTLVSWHNGQMEIKSLTSGAVISNPDTRLLALVHTFSQPHTIEEVIFASEDPEKWVQANSERLIKARILISVTEGKQESSHPWAWSALAYHQQSRRLGFHKTVKSMVATPRELVPTNWIPLPTGFVKRGREFTDVLEARKSSRAWSSIPISMETFSSFLWISARNRDPLDENHRKSQISRPYPSGGGVYSLELFIVLAENAVEGSRAGLYKYLPDNHGLYSVTERYADFFPFIEAAGSSAGSESPPVVILITSRFADQSAIYGDLAYSLILKEVGCLFQNFYLVGEYLHLKCCALGGGTPNDLLARLCNTNKVDNPLVGEFMLGMS